MDQSNKKTKFIIGGVIAVALIGLLLCICSVIVLGLGVDQAEENSRDAQRKLALLDIEIVLLSYNLKTGEYPEEIEVDRNQFIIGEDGVDLRDYLTSSDETDESSSAYCYKNEGTSYSLGIQLEDGSWYNSDFGSCDSSDLIR